MAVVDTCIRRYPHSSSVSPQFAGFNEVTAPYPTHIPIHELIPSKFSSYPDRNIIIANFSLVSLGDTSTFYTSNQISIIRVVN